MTHRMGSFLGAAFLEGDDLLNRSCCSPLIG